MFSRTYRANASIFKALIIGFSNYDQEPLKLVEADIESVYTLCITLLNMKKCNVRKFLNPTLKDINDTYNDFLLKDAKISKPEGAYSQYLIYYSGHGRMAKNKTMGIDLENNDVEIEDFVY